MSHSDCRACTATTVDAALCNACTEQLAGALKKLPGLIRDLEVTATRQARIGDTPRVDGQLEDLVAVDQIKAIPARLRSRMGRITLPATQLPVAPGAALLLRQVIAGVRSWATLIPSAPQPTVRRSLFIHRNRAGVRAVSTPATDVALLTWLHRVRKALADRIRHLEQAGEIHAKAIDMVAAIEATIDRRDPDVFAGVCEAVAVEVGWETGVIIPTAGKCGAPLLAPPDETSVQCLKCKAVWDVEERREAMADRIADRLGTVREVAGFLRTLELEVTVDKIDGWLRRGRIVDHGGGPTGRLVKVGEVRRYAEDLAERAKARKKERVSV